MVEDQENNEEIRNFVIEMTNQPDIYKLFRTDIKGEQVFDSIAMIPSLECSKFVGGIFYDDPDPPVVVKCQLNANSQKWVPFEQVF